MLTGVIRPVETRTMDVEGHSLAEIQEKLTAAAPAGWDLTSAPVAMVKGSTVFADVPSRFGPVNAKQERRADEWAALRLIRVEEYRRAEAIHHGHVEALAVELGVTVDLIEAFQRVLLRVGEAVYVQPRHGAGQYAHKEPIAS